MSQNVFACNIFQELGTSASEVKYMPQTEEKFMQGNGLHRAEYTLITSCKGGVGKSTSAVNTAAALARRGKRVLLVDCSFEMRCLDLLLGLEDEIVYDLYDAAFERAAISRAVLKLESCEGLYFIAAPFSGGTEITAKQLCGVFSRAEREYGFDHVILDTPGTLVSPELIGTGLIDRALIVASHQPSSIRAAEKTGEDLSKRIGFEGFDERLIINGFDIDGAISGERPGINEIIDRTFLRLGGIIPQDRGLMLSSERGELCTKGNCAVAFDNIACRLMGRYIPLFSGFTGISTKRRIKRLLR